jgi:hypothetical protein
MLADFITVNQPQLAMPPHLDLGYLVFCCSGRDVTNVVVGGVTAVSR